MSRAKKATAKVGSNALMFRKDFWDLYYYIYAAPETCSYFYFLTFLEFVVAGWSRRRPIFHFIFILPTPKRKKKEEESTKKKRRKNDQRSRESRITDIGEREDHSIEDIIYIYSSLSYDLSSPVADGGVFIRGIGSHALSPLRELPLSAVSRVSLRPPESPNMRRRKTLNRMMEKTLRVKERERKRKKWKSKEITADRSRGYTHHHVHLLLLLLLCTNIYKCIEINRSLYDFWLFQPTACRHAFSLLYLYFILVY